MGLELVERLLELNMDLYIINRGNSYWNGKFYEIIKGKNVIHLKFDRNDEKFVDNLKLLNLYFEYVIDFTCFDKRDVDNLFEGLEYKFKNYIFISSDSTYNSGDVGIIRNDEYFFNNKDNNIPLIVEDDLKYSDRKKAKKRDTYGYNKYKCEKRIADNLYRKDIKYYFLRLPDVIGPFDETYRIWYYTEWLTNQHILPIEIEKIDTIRKLSFVYSHDVCRVVLTILTESKPQGIYNIAHSESLTLIEFIEYIAKKLEVDFHYKVKDFATTYYPSVNIGSISNEKAIKELNFNPKSLFLAIDKSIEFFISAKETYPREYKEMVKDLPKKLKTYIESSL